ncbi:Guanine nucleotide-binding protein-like 3 [Physocladia obscura]|uniref:Guanine nucleotide-binding protein-like 3 n=1 Tax=Physocladia obscura TaxID=109957 RepID=A0AAD5X6L1_9FUNG|nr:Guanine nucleotide-binding protein-like 3 [Physocladia obscura]
MVARRAKSKRQPASKQYKIRANVNEHERKMRKEAKLNPHKKKLKKDPGIPSLLPFKEKLLQQIEETKRRNEAEKLTAKSERNSLASLARDAARRGSAFDFKNDDSNGGGFNGSFNGEAAAIGRKDNSKKAYYREFRKVVEQADVILQVLDARDPMGCRAKMIEEMIINAGINKRIILILNKIDLVPRDVVEKWLKYLRNEFPTIAFKASTQSQRTNLGRNSISTSHASSDLLNSSECLGADNLVKLLKNYCRNSNIKTSITVGVVGFPNVGKSSVINSLKRSKACNVGATPGVTKIAQQIHLDKNIKLLDCPGIVFSKGNPSDDPAAKAEVLLRNCVKAELIEDPIAPVEVIISRCTKSQIRTLYSVPDFVDTRDFLINLARQRGRLRKRGIPDIENTARSVLQDWNAGRVPFYTLPPETAPGVHVESSIVTAWGAEFAMPEIVGVEEQLLGTIGTKDTMGKMYAVRAGAAVEGELESGEMNEDVEDEEEDDQDFEDIDEDNEMDQDEADEEESDEEMTPVLSKPSAPPIALDINRLKAIASAKKSKSAAGPESRGPVLGLAEQLLNPQTNKDKKKAAKAQKKAARKNGKISTGSSEAYDFTEHFDLPNGDMDEDD